MVTQVTEVRPADWQGRSSVTILDIGMGFSILKVPLLMDGYWASDVAVRCKYLLEVLLGQNEDDLYQNNHDYLRLWGRSPTLQVPSMGLIAVAEAFMAEVNQFLAEPSTRPAKSMIEEFGKFTQQLDSEIGFLQGY